VVFDEQPDNLSDSVKQSLRSRPVIDIDDDEGDESPRLDTRLGSSGREKPESGDALSSLWPLAEQSGTSLEMICIR
jgi:hypothetical protein